MAKFTLTAAADEILKNQDLVRFTEEKAKSISQPKITAKQILSMATKPVVTGATLAKDVAQGIAKSGGSVALTLMGKDEFQPEDKNIRATKDIIFGKDPIKSLQTRIAESEIDIQRKISPTVGEKTAKGVSPLLAGIGVALTVGLDFTGAGGQKNAIKVLTKLNKVDDIGKVLKEIGVADDLIKEYAPLLAKTSKADDVSKIVNRLSEIQKTTKPVTQATKGAEIAEASAEMAESINKSKGFNWTQRGFLENVAKNRPDIPLKSGGQYVPRSTDRLAIKARTLINENLEAAEILSREFSDAGSATATELIKYYGDTKQLDKAAELAHFAAIGHTEAGRINQAAAIVGRLTPEGILRFAAREINRYNEAIDSTRGTFKMKKIPNITKEQAAELLSASKRIEKMKDGFEKAVAFKKLNDKIADLIPTPLWKKLIGAWKAGLLTGLKTTGLNTFSNLFHGVSEGVKDVPATVIDSVVSLFTGKRTLALTGKGTISGLEEGFKKGWRFLKTGVDERDVLAKLDYKKISFGKSKFAKAIQGYEETIFKIMGAEDQPFYYAAKARSLQSQAIAQAKNLKLKSKEAKTFIEKLVSSPTDEMLKYATGDAEIAVFQNKTALGSVGKKLQEIKGGEFVVPFSRTPSAVATQLINYSPVGIVKTIIENIGKGKFDQRLFAQGLGRGITGTAIMYVGSELARKGLITTTYPKTEREQKLWEAEGRQPNAIKINGKWRNVNVLGPAGMALLTGAHYQSGLQESGSPLKAMSQGVIGGMSSLKEQTFLSGINQVVEALDDPSRFASGYFSSTLSSFIPTIIGDISKATDPLERKTIEIPDKLKAKIPWLRETLEPKVNILGEEMQTKGSWAEIMVDPSRPSEELSSEVISEFRRLYDVGYKISPTQLGTKTGYAALTPEDNTLLWKKAGQIIQSKITNLLKLEEYKKLPDDKKAEAIQKVIEKSNVVARAEMVMALTEDLNGQALKDKLSELKQTGLMTRDVFNKFIELK